MSYIPPKHKCSLSGRQENLAYISKFNALECCLYLPSKFNTKTKHHLESSGAIIKEARRIGRMRKKIIHPLSIFRVIWETVYTFVGYASLYIYPLHICFSTERDETSGLIILSVFFCQVMTLIDMIINLCTGYYEEDMDEVILNCSKICKRYWSSYINWIVLITAIPFGIPLYFVTTDPVVFHICNLILCLKIFEIKKLLSYFDEILLMINLNPIIAKLLDVVAIGIILTHWMGCVAYSIPVYAEYLFGFEISKRTWFYKIYDSDDYHVYIDMLFRSVSLIITVGHDALVTDTNLDSIVILILLIIAVVFIKIAIVYVLDVIHLYTTAVTNYEMELDQVYSYMRYKQLSMPTQNRILDYYDYKFEKMFLDEKGLQAVASQTLNEIDVYLRFKMIKTINALKGLEDSIAEEIINRMKEEIYLPNDIIIKSNTRGNCMYFLYSGTVCVKTPNGKEVCHITQGSYFGEISLLKGFKRSADVIALEICHVFRLDKKTCKHFLFTVPDILQQFKATAEKRISQTRQVEETHKRLLMEKIIHMDAEHYSY